MMRCQATNEMRPLQKAEIIKKHFDFCSIREDWTKLYLPPYTSLNWSFIIRKERVLELIDTGGGRILDIGCGPGIMIRELRERNYEYFGIDISEEMIKEARRRFAEHQDPQIHLMAGDVTKIGYPDNYFDGVIAMGLLEYLSDLKGQFKELRRVMRAGGFLIVTVPLKYQLDRFMVYLLTLLRKILAPTYHKLTNINPRPIERFFFSSGELDSMAEKAGFKKVGFAYYNFTILPYPFTVLLPRISYLLNSKWERFYKSFYMSFFSTAYIAKYEKIAA